MKRVHLDINANDSDIALNTRSKVTLPQDLNEQKRKELIKKDAEYTEFLHHLFDEDGGNNEEEHGQDEDFGFRDASPESMIDEYDHRRDKVPKRILRDLNNGNDESKIETKKKPMDNYSSRKRINTHIRIPFGPKQRQSIKDQINELFQLLVIIRHLSLNSEKRKDAHDLSTNLLRQFNAYRLGSIQSIRYAMAKRSGILNRYNLRNMTQQEANQIAFAKTKHCYIDSMMNMEGIDEYFAFNAHVCRSYPAVLNRFRGSLLSEDLIIDAIPNRISKVQNRNFTEVEDKLLGLGIREFGEKLNQPLISSKVFGMKHNQMIHDWTALRDRFLPHREIKTLQDKIALIRKTNHELQHDYRVRVPHKKMNDLELSLLYQGTKKYGMHSFSQIAKEILPDWTSRELKRNYERKLKPILVVMETNVQSKKKPIEFYNPKMNGSNHQSGGEDHQQEMDLFLNLTTNHNVKRGDAEDNDGNSSDGDIDMLQALFCE